MSQYWLKISVFETFLSDRCGHYPLWGICRDYLRKSFCWKKRRHQQDMATKSEGREDRIFWTRRWPLPSIAASSRQPAAKEDETVDKDCSLDLNPNPSYPRDSVESVECDDSLDPGGHPVTNSWQGSVSTNYYCPMWKVLVKKFGKRHQISYCVNNCLAIQGLWQETPDILL